DRAGLRPVALPEFAAGVRLEGAEEEGAVDIHELPSLFQSLSLPKVEKGEKPEAKKSVPLTLVRSWAPRALTITVPAAVPSVRHSPALVPSLAVKKTVPPASTNGPGDEPAAVLKESSMSLTRKAWVSGRPCWARATETVVT